MPGNPVEDLMTALSARGWQIRPSTSREPLLPAPLQQRYPRVPPDVTRFLERLDSCTNREENVWFLCREDYRRVDENGFRWNEFELMSLEAADGDPVAQAAIRAFWDRHFPFMLAVHSDYDYLAVSVDARSYGEIVHGSGPDFESTSEVASTFGEFVILLGRAASGAGESYPLSLFL